MAAGTSACARGKPGDAREWRAPPRAAPGRKRLTKIPAVPARVGLLERCQRLGRQELAAPAACEEARGRGCGREVHARRRGGVGEPAQHAERRHRHLAAPREERPEHDRHVGGHGREDVLERRERHQHDIGGNERQRREPVEQPLKHRATASWTRCDAASGTGARPRATSRSRRCGRSSSSRPPASASSRPRTSAASAAVALAVSSGTRKPRSPAKPQHSATARHHHASACARATRAAGRAARPPSRACRWGAGPRSPGAAADPGGPAAPRAPRTPESRASGPRASTRAGSRPRPSASVPAHGDASVTTSSRPPLVARQSASAVRRAAARAAPE